MKLGTENRTKTIVAGVLLILAVVLLVRAFRGGGQDTTSPATAGAAPQTQATAGESQPPSAGPPARKQGPHPLLAKTLDPSLRFDLLKSSEDVTYKGTGRDIFRSQPDVADIPKPAPPDVHPGPPTPPPPPPINLKFYGFAGPKNGARRIFLLQGEDIFVAKEGDVVDRRYKILRIGPNSVDVEDVLTNNRQTLPLRLG